MTPPWKHMAPGDVPLFASYVLSDEGLEVEQWEFDVRLGPGVDPGEFYDPTLRNMATYLTQLKADAIGWRAGVPTIFEVKPDARLSAFGQVLAYTWFFARERGQNAYRAVITDTMTEQVRMLYEAHVIDIKLVHPATPEQILQAFAWTRPRTF